VDDLLSCFLRDLGGLYRARRLYPAGNTLIRKAAEKAAVSLAAFGRSVRIARLGEEVVVEDQTLPEPSSALTGLLKDLAQQGQEAVQIEPDAGSAELEEWIGRLAEGREASRGGSVRAGIFRLDNLASDPALAELAVGYLQLLPEVQETMEVLSAEKSEGLLRAEEIVRAIAGRLAAGEDLFRPIRELKSHDEYTFTHALNVCVLSAALTQALGLPRDRVNTVALAALCHDLGKERVPPEILNKQGRLTPEERETMDSHPTEGAKMLLRMGGVDPLLPVVAHQHHRGADGGGYPRAAAAGAVHPVSLLVSVADVYDALRTVRPYRAALSAPEALSILLKDTQRGYLHRTWVSAFAALMGLLRPGRRVQLTDGRSAVVVQSGDPDCLRPVVETDEGNTVDLGSDRLLAIGVVEGDGATTPPGPAPN